MTTTDTDPKRMDGIEYKEALQHALSACPKGKSRKKGGTAGRLSHILFHGAVVGGSDGRKLIKARLPPNHETIGKPLAVTRDSVRLLATHLNWAASVCAQENTLFQVVQDGLNVRLYSGDKLLIDHKLTQADVGAIPATWLDPVDGNQQVISDGLIDLDEWKTSVNGRKSWGKYRVAARFRGFGGPRAMLRIDIVDETAMAPSNARLFASVFMLPKGAPPAPLPPAQGELGYKADMGVSIASLDWSAVATDVPKPSEGGGSDDEDDEDRQPGDDSDPNGGTVMLGRETAIEDLRACDCGAKVGEPCRDGDDACYPGNMVHAKRVYDNEAGESDGGEGEEKAAAGGKKGGGKRGGGGRKKAAAVN